MTGLVRARRSAVILVCGKCLERVGEGKALRRALKEAAAARLEDQASSARKVRLVRTSCLGLCPRRAVVTASAATLARGEMVIVREPGDAASAVALLLPRHA